MKTVMGSMIELVRKELGRKAVATLEPLKTFIDVKIAEMERGDVSVYDAHAQIHMMASKIADDWRGTPGFILECKLQVLEEAAKKAGICQDEMPEPQHAEQINILDTVEHGEWIVYNGYQRLPPRSLIGDLRHYLRLSAKDAVANMPSDKRWTVSFTGLRAQELAQAANEYMVSRKA